MTATSSTSTLPMHAQQPTPQSLTPSGSPPNHHPVFAESKLAHLLANLDSGTHIICRDERETPEERRMSFGEGGFPTPPPSRRPSILAQFVSRPNFSFSHSTPATPLSASHPKESGLPSGLAMTPSASHDLPIQHLRTRSTPASGGDAELPEGMTPAADGKVRSGTMKVAGFSVGVGAAAQAQVQSTTGAKRHFDPSRDPKLLGLL